VRFVAEKGQIVEREEIQKVFGVEIRRAMLRLRMRGIRLVGDRARASFDSWSMLLL